VTRTDRPIVAEAPGVRITASARGAHLMSWTTHGIDRLWMSPLSRHGQAQALRGGVPVLFPQFGTFGDLPKHGFARTADWEPVRVPPEQGRASLAFQLTDSEETRAVWPHPFRLRLDISASAIDLTMRLVVENRGQDVARFTGGLHTYLAVADPEAWIDGLAGCHVWDGASTESPHFSERVEGRIRALDTQDLVIAGAIAPVVLNDAVLGAMRVAAEGFANRVVWNPGPGHTLPDVAPGDEARFVCIEPTAVVPVVLPAGGVWEARQHLTLG
jgi:glucose-6-phosphate 1-epimerase